MNSQSFVTEFFSDEKDERVEILCDTREGNEIVALLQEKGVSARRMSLPVGDFILSERVVAERKTRSDFENSIIDGRLFEQAGRLAESFSRVIILVEGTHFEERVKREALLGAIASLVSDYGISVFFTRDLERTAEFLFAVAKREQLAEKKELRLQGRKRAFSLEQHQQLVVESLPFVGPKLSRALLKEFGSVRAIAEASEKELMRVEKLGEKKAKAIRKVLNNRFD